MQYRSQAKPGWHIIDDKMVHTDSTMESTIIEQLVKVGFSGRWRRLRRGLAYGFSTYTPDVELSVLHDSMNRRALVEFKAFSATEFTMKRRKAMLAVAHFYHDALCMLYVYKTKQWYLIERDGSLLPTSQPTPGGVTIDQLPKPRFYLPVWNRYGRSYLTRPSTLLAKKTADGLDFFVKTFFYSPKKPRHTKKR